MCGWWKYGWSLRRLAYIFPVITTNALCVCARSWVCMRAFSEFEYFDYAWIWFYYSTCKTTTDVNCIKTRESKKPNVHSYFAPLRPIQSNAAPRTHSYTEFYPARTRQNCRTIHERLYYTSIKTIGWKNQNRAKHQWCLYTAISFRSSHSDGMYSCETSNHTGRDLCE